MSASLSLERLSHGAAVRGMTLNIRMNKRALLIVRHLACSVGFRGNYSHKKAQNAQKSLWILCLFVASPHGLGGVTPAGREPRISCGIESGIIRIKVDKTTLDEKVANFENVAPASGMGHAGSPRSVEMLAGAGSFDGKGIGAGHDPVEAGVVVQDVLDQAAEVGE